MANTKCRWYNKWFGKYPEPTSDPIADIPVDVRLAYHRLLNETSKLKSRVDVIQRNQTHDALAAMVRSITKVGEVNR